MNPNIKISVKVAKDMETLRSPRNTNLECMDFSITKFKLH